GGAHRRGQPLPGDDTDRPAAVHPRPPVRGDLRLHAGPERVPLRAHLPHHERRADGARGRHHGADPGRRLLLGTAHGGGAARLDPGGGDLFVLCRLLRRGPDLRLREKLTAGRRASLLPFSPPSSTADSNQVPDRLDRGGRCVVASDIIRRVMLDLKIVGGQIVDGTGAAGARADLGITGDTITAVGDLVREPAGRTIDAAGLTVTPGFIDVHTHSDWRLWGNRRAESKIRQGVTTEVVGNCGFSPAPVSDEFRSEMQGFALYVPPGMDFSWSSVGDYLARYESEGVALNVAQLIGHGTLRLAAMGFARRPPTAAEQAHMERMMDEAMADGAYGLATGLIYAPGSYAATEEIIGIARRAAGGRGFYASHIRGEGATLLDAVAEAIRVGREGGLPAQVSHVKAAGRPNWGKVADALALIDTARDQGQDVMGDVYPYTASSTTLRTLLPDWVLEGGIDAMLKRLADPGTRERIRREL